MKYSTVLFAAVFAAGASAQVTRADFPACALPCLQEAIAGETDCTVDDIACSCLPANNKLIVAKATPCVLAACEGADLSKTLDVSGKICAPGNDAGGAPVKSSTKVETSTKVEETTSKATETSTKVETSTSKAAETTPAPIPTGNVTIPTTTASPPAFTGAAGKIGAGLGSVAAFALAALAL